LVKNFQPGDPLGSLQSLKSLTASFHIINEEVPEFDKETTVFYPIGSTIGARDLLSPTRVYSKGPARLPLLPLHFDMPWTLKKCFLAEALRSNKIKRLA
jgi:hypothetical protein